METNTTLLILTFNKDHLLEQALPTIACQDLSNIDVLIIDDGIPNNAETLAKKYGFKYIFTGQRNLIKPQWRVMGFAVNIAIKNFALTPKIIISQAEILHHQKDTLPFMSSLIKPKYIIIPSGKRQWKPKRTKVLNTEHPFCQGLWRNDFMNIGGYDERFTGRGCEDQDLVSRFKRYGCEYIQIKRFVTHLYHEKFNTQETIGKDKLRINKNLWDDNNSKNIIVTNQDKEWGIYESV